MMVGRLLSFWDGTFSGAMLNFQGVIDKREEESVNLKMIDLDRKLFYTPPNILIRTYGEEKCYDLGATKALHMTLMFDPQNYRTCPLEH